MNPETPSEVKKTNAKWWLDEIEAAKSRMDDWYKKAQKANDRYKIKSNRENGSINILWANVETQKSAIGDDFGKPDVIRSNVPDDDGLTRHVSLVWQRAIDASVKDDGDNHDIKLAVHDVFLPGRGQIWLELNPVTDQDGNVIWVEAPLVRLQYEEYLEGAANSYKMLPWVARRHLFSLDDLKEKFAKTAGVNVRDIPRDYSLPLPEKDRANEEKAKSEQFKRACVWEIWDKLKRQRLYVAEGYEHAVLKTDDDPYRLRQFFPCPRPILANGDEGWQEPITDYSEYEDQALELDKVSQRIFVLNGMLKRHGVYNSRFKELQNLPSADDGVLLPAESWDELQQSGGLNRAVEWEDVSQIIQILEALYKNRGELIKLIYELSGISDLARGSTDPNETLGAQKLKRTFGSSRFSSRQEEARRFAADGYALKGELIAEHFPRAQIEAMSGMNLPLQVEIDAAKSQLQALQQSLMMAQQQNLPMPQIDKKQLTRLARVAETKFPWEEIADVLQSDIRRCYNIGIETDQSNFVDEEVDKKQRIEFFGVLNQALNTLMPMLEGNPANGEVIKELLIFVLKGFKVGRAMEEGIEQAIDNAIATAQQKAAQPQQPQQDPVQAAQASLVQAQAAKAQIDVRTAQEMGQLKVQIEQIDLELKQRELEMKGVELQIKQIEAQAKQAEIGTKAAQRQMEITAKQQELETKAAGQQLEMQSKIVKSIADSMKDQVQAVPIGN